MAFTEDLTEFFGTDDFAITAMLAGTTSVNGIFDNAALAIPGGEAAVEGSVPTFTCALADIPAVAQGQTIVINSTTYTIIAVHPDGTGVVVLGLSE